MGAWLAGIGGALAGGRWGLKASPRWVVFSAASVIAVFCLLLLALLARLELVERDALAARGYEVQSTPEASVVGGLTLLGAALLLTGTALAALRRAPDGSPSARRIVSAYALLAAGACAAAFVALLWIAEDLAFMSFAFILVPSLLLVWHTRRIPATPDAKQPGSAPGPVDEGDPAF